jgi:pSer/pThr/pTyr-binding forkhead associated (FHA) protein
MTHVYCPECGFQSPEAANFCARCGAALISPVAGETTLSLAPDEVADAESVAPDDAPDDAADSRAVLVVRSGGGRAGETFTPSSERTLVGRSPECDVFLDDVTVSRRHAELVREGDRFTIRDLGSLNGTFVNRRRIESSVLDEDDEVQIGKYRLTFLRR